MVKLSIIMPCYNHGAYINEAIQSVEKCTDKELYEIIIINDGSTDAATITVLNELSTKGYNVINQKNQGLGAARNNGIKLAKGKYILPLDSDNRIYPKYIYEGINILDAQPGVAVVYGDSLFFGEKNGRDVVGEFNLQRIMLGNYIDACAVFRKSVWEEVGGYDEKMPVMGKEDWNLWLDIAFKGHRFYYINDIVFDYRVLGNSMLRSIDNSKMVKISEYMAVKYKQQLNLGFVNDLVIKDFKKNKKLIVKLFFVIFFPGMIDFLYRRKIIKNKRVLF